MPVNDRPNRTVCVYVCVTDGPIQVPNIHLSRFPIYIQDWFPIQVPKIH